MSRTRELLHAAAVAVFSALLVGTPVARADTTADETISIGSTNVANVGIDCNTAGTSCTFTETMLNSYSQKVQDGADFDFNSNASLTVDAAGLTVYLVGGGSTSDVKYSFTGSGGNVGGLGSFNYQFSMIGSNGGTSGSNKLGSGTTSVAGLQVTLDGIGLNAATLLVNNSDGNNMAIHWCSPTQGVQSGSCPDPTGFASNTGQFTVPEPGSMALLGGGLMGLAGFWRARRVRVPS
jgi:PEP-CTERM motif